MARRAYLTILSLCWLSLIIGPFLLRSYSVGYASGAIGVFVLAAPTYGLFMMLIHRSKEE